MQSLGRGVIVAAALWTALAGEGEAGTLRAGTGVRDITPETGRSLFGYVREFTADGVALREFARALVLEGGVPARKVALVTMDLGTAVGKDALVASLAEKGCAGFEHTNVLLAGTHTHASQDIFFTIDDWVIDQVAEAVCEADREAKPARAGWGTAELSASVNRSLEAHLANHGMEDLVIGQGQVEQDPDSAGSDPNAPAGFDHTIDQVLRLLRVEVDRDDDGTFETPLAAWAHWSTHPTAFVPGNTLYSADLAGSAVRRFEESFCAWADRETCAFPVAVFTNGNQGDQIPFYDDYNQHAVSDRMGLRIAGAMKVAWDAAAADLADGIALDAVWTGTTFAHEQEAELPTSRLGWWGLSFFGGAENGPSYFYLLGTEGRKRPKDLADPLHGRKILVSPAPYAPTPELQVLRIADRLLLSVPGEPTVELGRRIRAAALESAPAGVADALVISLANQYTGYYTTPEEYEQQHYEGGHTVFGRSSGHRVRQALAALVEAMRDGRTIEPAAAVPFGSGTDDTEAPGQSGPAPVVLSGPPPAVRRMDTVEIAWQGSPRATDRKLDEPLIRLEQLTADGWKTIDSDLGRAFVWQVDDDGVFTARYDLAPDLPLARSRFRIENAGGAASTSELDVLPSDALRILGVTATALSESAVRLVFRVQNPPPDPARHLLHRSRVPGGGTIVAASLGVAAWSDADAGYVLDVAPPVPPVIEISERGVTDAFGNTSGAATTLTVGEVAPIVWPPSIGVAGGPVPGPFGIGTVPP